MIVLRLPKLRLSSSVRTRVERLSQIPVVSLGCMDPLVLGSVDLLPPFRFNVRDVASIRVLVIPLLVPLDRSVRLMVNRMSLMLLTDILSLRIRNVEVRYFLLRTLVEISQVLLLAEQGLLLFAYILISLGLVVVPDSWMHV